MPNTKDFWWGVALTVSVVVMTCLAANNAKAEDRSVNATLGMNACHWMIVDNFFTHDYGNPQRVAREVWDDCREANDVYCKATGHAAGCDESYSEALASVVMHDKGYCFDQLDKRMKWCR